MIGHRLYYSNILLYILITEDGSIFNIINYPSSVMYLTPNNINIYNLWGVRY